MQKDKKYHIHEEIAVAIWLGLFLVTCGFYSLYLQGKTFWQLQENKEVQSIRQEARNLEEIDLTWKVYHNDEY